MSRHYRNHIILFTKNSILFINSAEMYGLNHLGHFRDIRKDKKGTVALSGLLKAAVPFLN